MWVVFACRQGYRSKGSAYLSDLALSLEKEVREANLSGDDLVKFGQEKCKPVMETLRDRLNERRAKSYGAHGTLDKVVNYALNQ
ncbi:MAG: hypothetical protein NZM25_01665 [Leptospiraceae bacterium]|nr:hypothetical protein [Leptospiraceae bacterium]MDW8306885.1 hypothetical protein [Leptospiraceae bacterium]